MCEVGLRYSSFDVYMKLEEKLHIYQFTMIFGEKVRIVLYFPIQSIYTESYVNKLKQQLVNRHSRVNITSLRLAIFYLSCTATEGLTKILFSF